MSSVSDESRRRTSSQSDTIRSSRSDNSPRIQRSHNSVSCPPVTPPLSRALPHRHSISHTPATPLGRGTVISVAAAPPTATESRESLSVDSGHPDTSERLSRSPPGHGSESDSRSLDLDSLSVDEGAEEAGPTVIQVTGGGGGLELDASVHSAEVRQGDSAVDVRALTTVQTSL